MITETAANNPLAFLQPKPDEKAREKGKDEMGQSDFIELMIAQMKNQDPTKPLDPNEFMSQLAQFSTVNGIQELQKTVESLVEMMATDQSIKAAGLVGHEVMAEGGAAQFVPGGTISGQVELDGSATDVTVKIYGENGALVRTIPLGVQGEGKVPFKWDGFAEDGSVAPPGNYRLVAEVERNGETQQATLKLRTRVESVSLSPYGGDLTLNLANGSSVPLASIQEIL